MDDGRGQEEYIRRGTEGRVEPYSVLHVLHGETSGDRLKSTFGDHGERGFNSSDWMLDHGAGHARDTPTGVLGQHLLDGKLRDIDVAPQIRCRQPFEVFQRVLRERLRQEDARVIDDTIYRAKNLHGP